MNQGTWEGEKALRVIEAVMAEVTALGDGVRCAAHVYPRGLMVGVLQAFPEDTRYPWTYEVGPELQTEGVREYLTRVVLGRRKLFMEQSK